MRVVINASLAKPKKKNLICNFRAPSMVKFLEWKKYVSWAQENGLDVCHLTLSLVGSFMKGVEGSAQVPSGKQIVNITQNNVFEYRVPKPRRIPYSLDCVKPQFRRTFSSALFEAYMLEKARGIASEFSYMDFLELERDAFHRIARRLKRKGRIIANPRRTIPRYYILTERLKELKRLEETSGAP